MLGERATPEKVAEVRAHLGLDRPLWQQYGIYVGKVVRGDLGVSIVRGDPVLTDLLRRFPATVELATAAIVLAIALGIPIGVASAVWRNSIVDSVADRKSTRLNSSHLVISYAVFCLKKKNNVPVTTHCHPEPG